ncbi:DUF5710 domain-containing protein [Alcaligenes endophyticus]|uniref:DUF5710 domain-containing protein n=1 Tax=Alcaligenes endophyticus TaxID=1929088 RepID=A0ABT8EK68_9BURK|nr:DUF5710 domain-containing protein [Alcaligenes endophyticus]MCX5591926.1 DUF5710 domain-containing protein [Alcaligenes endophyticus]MDN4121615.1 DUF5710 domain-containing protein [Alcaligenes endophyticus]
MSRINLNVPFAQKDQAKELGARWDSIQKTWYLPPETDPTPFARWLPKNYTAPTSTSDAVEYPIRASHYFIAKSHTTCWRCKQMTAVFAFALPPGHEVYEWEDDQTGYWYSPDGFCILSMVSDLAAPASHAMHRLTKNYHMAYSKKADARYFMNHCEHCNATQGDFYMHHEPGGAFFPTSEWEAQCIHLYPVNAPFMGNGDTGLHSEDYFYDAMQIQSAL